MQTEHSALTQRLIRDGLAVCEPRTWLRERNRIVWITHAGVARCVQWLLGHGAALPHSTQWTLPAPRYGQWMRVGLPP